VTSSSSAVAAVLAGQASYDTLSREDRAKVRRGWASRAAHLLDQLDLQAKFRADGQTWVELGDDGELRWGR
jgi:hypothetical protein